LLRVEVDCDRDCLRFLVRQHGTGFCHRGTPDCFGADRGLDGLARRLHERLTQAPSGSYTRRLLDQPDLLDAKLREEAGELAVARTRDEVVHEAADVLYFTLVALLRAGADLDAVESLLDQRALAVTRRAGDAKPTPPEES
jgi:phosphoribosyl-ATP pyrophosphohydrolase